MYVAIAGGSIGLYDALDLRKAARSKSPHTRPFGAMNKGLPVAAQDVEGRGPGFTQTGGPKSFVDALIQYTLPEQLPRRRVIAILRPY